MNAVLAARSSPWRRKGTDGDNSHRARSRRPTESAVVRLHRRQVDNGRLLGSVGGVFSWLTWFWEAGRRGSRLHPHLTDVVVALTTFACGVALATQNPASTSGLSGFRLAVGLIGCGALVFRRRRPVAVLGVILGCSSSVFVSLATVEDSPPLTLAAGVVLYSVAIYRSREMAWKSALCTTVVLLPPALLRNEGVVPAVVGLLTWVVAATAVGDSVRSRRAYVATVMDRVLRAEQSREQEARRQVAEERLRIARELHDVIAHHIALVKVQASVASHLLYKEPARADEALGHIRHASRTVLQELRSLVNVLRDTAEPASTAPAPGLARLPDLLASFEASGMPVSRRTAGTPRDLPALADLAAYRIVQESLTNAHKHARGAQTTVDIGYSHRELSLRVHNRIPAEADVDPMYATGPRGGKGREHPDRGGHGIVGMRERMAAVGGRLRAGPDPDGGFVVTASMPVPEPPKPMAPPGAAADWTEPGVGTAVVGPGRIPEVSER